jgi:hypothetical protein
MSAASKIVRADLRRHADIAASWREGARSTRRMRGCAFDPKAVNVYADWLAGRQGRPPDADKTVNHRAWFMVLPVLVLVAFSAVLPLMTVVNYSVQDTFGNNVLLGRPRMVRGGAPSERMWDAFLRQIAFSASSSDRDPARRLRRALHAEEGHLGHSSASC